MTLFAPWLIAVLCLAPAPDDDARAADLAAARALFERNIAAIQEQDREAYLSCYDAVDGLVRTGPDGALLGWDDLAAGTPATGSDDWPDELVAHGLALHWLADGLVYGTYRYRTSDAGVIREGLSERVFRRTEEGWRIVVTTAFDAPPGVPPPPLALIGATLYDGSGGPALSDAVIVTRDGRIESVGPRATTPVPEGVDVVDLSGKFVVPGLIDTHVHYSQTGWADGRPDARDLRDVHPYEQVAAELEARPDRFHRAFLASGVTAVFDVGGFPWTRRLGAGTENSTVAPHVAATGALLATWVPSQLALPDRSQFVLIEDSETVRRTVRAHAAAGSDAIKVWFIVRDPSDVAAAAPLVAAAGDEARALGLPLVVHATQLEAARASLEAGAALLVHSVDDAPVDAAFIEAALAAGTAYCPTLTVGRGYEQLYRGELNEELRDQLALVHPSIAERVEQTTELGLDPRFTEERLAGWAEAQERERELMAANLLALHRAGVPVVAGTDAGNPLTLHGPSIFPELEAMQAAGLSPLEVLTAATRDAARAMGRGEDLGLIAPGRVADLLVLTEDPAQDVSALRSLTQVMRAGALQSRESLRPR